MITLSDKEYTKFGGDFSSDIRCNYCGEAVTVEVQYGGLNPFKEYKCECMGAVVSKSLACDVEEAEHQCKKLAQEYALHMEKIHASIRRKLFDQEMTKLKLKYEVE